MPFACSVSGPLDVIDVDWSSLMPKQKQEPRTPGAALLRFTPGAVLLRAGVSRRLAGPQLLARVKEVCSRELEDPKGKCANLSLKECSSLNKQITQICKFSESVIHIHGNRFGELSITNAQMKHHLQTRTVINKYEGRF